MAAVAGHYARRGRLAARILELAAAGEASGPLRAADLATFDQLHPRGRQATDELADLVDWPSRFLDLGCGLGGPARYLVETRGGEAVGIDLTESFCSDARDLAQATGLAGGAHFACADATRLPFAEGTFPLVLTQAAAMNIPDKAALYREAARVLAPGGRFLLHDIHLGPAGDPRFPLPWASTPETSHLLPPEAVRALIEAAGLSCRLWQDRTTAVREAIEAQRRQAAELKAAGLEPPAGVHSLQGPEFREMASNLARSLAERQVVVTTGLFEKPA